jgi:hypothetical protein
MVMVLYTNCETCEILHIVEVMSESAWDIIDFQRACKFCFMNLLHTLTTCHLYREAVEAGRKFHGTSDQEKS